MMNRWRGSNYIEDPKNAKERYQSKSNRKKPIAKRKMHSQTKQAIKGSKNQLDTRRYYDKNNQEFKEIKMEK